MGEPEVWVNTNEDGGTKNKKTPYSGAGVKDKLFPVSNETFKTIQQEVQINNAK